MRGAVTRWLKPLIGLALTAAFLWLLAGGLDIEALGRALAELSIPFLALALTFLAVGYVVRIVRWWWMLRTLEPSLPFRACVWPFLTSIAVNNLMPFRAGDALRLLGFRQQLRSPVVRVLGTLVIERVLDLVVLLGFFFLGLFGLPSGAFPERVVVAATWLAGLSIAAVLALILLTPWLGRIIHRIAAHQFFASRSWSEAVVNHSSHFIAALSLMRSPARFLVLLGLSVLTWTFEGAVFATVAAAVHATASSLGPWFSLGTGTLATLIPSSPGYVGTFDYFAARGLAAYGATTEVSVAFALTVHAVLWAPLTAAGLLYLILHGTRFWAIRPNPAYVLSKD
jgi:glycosyltransferase 2 family protein